MPKHSPEPWSVEALPETDAAPSFRINHSSAMAKEYHVAEFNGERCFSAGPDAERAVACVNACAGMDDPEAEIAGMKQQLELAYAHGFMCP